jgi:hypothetical protein
MKQWVLASHNHNDAHKKLPTQCNQIVNTNRNYWSATALLLPFMEASGIYERLATGAGITPHDLPEDLRTTNLASVICPSDTTTRIPGLNCPKGNICVSYGDGCLQANGDVTSLSHAQSVMSRGIYVSRAVRTMADITDGLSNTIAISEVVTGSTERLQNVRGGIDRTGTSIQQGSANEIIPSNCLNNAYSLTDRNQIRTPYIHADRWRCCRYLDGRPIYTGFNTIVPPNSPNCNRQGATGDAETTWAIYSASSFHSGGVNCGIADGGVRFISETVDAGHPATVLQGSSLRGKSPCGVWGAIGTPKSGETVTLP